MKKYFVFLILILNILAAQAKEPDYIELYNKVEMPNFKLVHQLDPYQNEDYYKYAWSPYPLFRTPSTLYFKGLVIPPGYYLLTPRTIKSRNYVFFKQGGRVKFVIPVVKKEIIDPLFYTNRMPKPKETKWQKFKGKCSKMFNRVFKNTKKRPPPDAFITSDWVEGTSLLMVCLYFGTDKYIMVFKTSLY